MKRAILGALAGLGVVAAAVALAEQRGEVFQQHFTPALTSPVVAAGGEMIVVASGWADKGQMVIVLDPRLRAMCVYQIEAATGKITLKSARNIQWDLQITDLNNEPPLPKEIRSLAEQR